ncbi:hypothetical protein EVAR_92196_1 [Eumeta japonica]|uniref:Uncharacterized protein n=1 Tax=Eumeta variegata TaxID=151549 RepID=A0A4C1TNF4_EUMVA|nr:hypothetical protein EVAR_92196_1 [Eumeta japonica]
MTSSTSYTATIIYRAIDSGPAYDSNLGIAPDCALAGLNVQIGYLEAIEAMLGCNRTSSASPLSGDHPTDLDILPPSLSTPSGCGLPVPSYNLLSNWEIYQHDYISPKSYVRMLDKVEWYVCPAGLHLLLPLYPVPNGFDFNSENNIILWDIHFNRVTQAYIHELILFAFLAARRARFVSQWVKGGSPCVPPPNRKLEIALNQRLKRTLVPSQRARVSRAGAAPVRGPGRGARALTAI